MVSRRKFDREALEAHMLCGVGEVPLYEPTEKEFEQGPYAYLRTIRAEAQKYGLCRIRYARGASGGGGDAATTPPKKGLRNCRARRPQQHRIQHSGLRSLAAPSLGCIRY